MAGDAIITYRSGLGAVNPPVEAGAEAPGQEPLARTVENVAVTVGGVPAAVLFSGLAPGFSGLYQVNVFVPGGDDGYPVGSFIDRGGSRFPYGPDPIVLPSWFLSSSGSVVGCLQEKPRQT